MDISSKLTTVNLQYLSLPKNIFSNIILHQKILLLKFADFSNRQISVKFDEIFNACIFVKL